MDLKGGKGDGGGGGGSMSTAKEYTEKAGGKRKKGCRGSWSLLNEEKLSTKTKKGKC